MTMLHRPIGTKPSSCAAALLAAACLAGAGAWAAPVAPSGTAELEEELPAAAPGRTLPRPNLGEGAAWSRTVDVLIDMQDRSTGLNFNSTARSPGREAQALATGNSRLGAGALSAPRAQGFSPGLIPAAAPQPMSNSSRDADAPTPQGGLFGMGAVPTAVPREPLTGAGASPAAQARSLRDGDAAPAGGYRSSPGAGLRSLDGPGEPGLLQTLLAWVRENRALVAGGALVLLVLVWGTTVAVSQQQQRR